MSGRLGLWLLVLMPGALMACGGRGSAVRPCFANQKTLTGAAEMYRLDNNLGWDQIFARWGEEGDGEPVGDGTWARRIPAAFLRELVEKGYLQSILEDPRQGSGSERNYWFCSWGNNVICLRHGEIQPVVDRAPPRSQLLHRGFDDPRALEQAFDLDPYKVPQERWEFLFTLMLYLAPGTLLGLCITSRAAVGLAARVIPLAILCGPIAAVLPWRGGSELLVIGLWVLVYAAIGGLLAMALRGLGRSFVPSCGVRFVATKGGSQ